MCWTLDPFFFRRTERPDRTGTKSCLNEMTSLTVVDVGRHLLRTNTLVFCVVACAKGYRRTDLAGEAQDYGHQHVFLPKERNERASFRSVRFYKVEQS